MCIVDSLEVIPDHDPITAIVNLAGSPIVGLPWVKRRRASLLGSRLTVTRAVVRLIARLRDKPEVLVNASAIGFYGISGDEPLSEDSTAQPIFQSRPVPAMGESGSSRRASRGAGLPASNRLGAGR